MVTLNKAELEELYQDILLTLLNNVDPGVPEWSVTLSVTAYVRAGKLASKLGRITLHTGSSYPETNDIDDQTSTMEVKLDESGEWLIEGVEHVIFEDGPHRI